MKALTISGWTQPADALATIAPDAHHLDYADAPSIAAIAANLPLREVDLVIGWSLGAIIARELCAEGTLKARAFVSLCAPYQFVRSGVVEDAMPPDTFQQFYTNYRDDTQRTVDRFHALVAKGDRFYKQVMQALEHHPQVLATNRWLPWMDFLESHSAHGRDYSRLPPTLILHGMQDAIVPHAQSHLLHQAIPDAVHRSWQGAAHALHLHDPARLREEIADFYDKSQ